MSIVTLTTDFGLQNEFVGVLKGVILGITPNTQIVDISHGISPQNIHEGAYTLWRAYSYFPEHTVHVFVVDPGVGTSRRPIAARVGDHFFVGPDNGFMTRILVHAEERNQPVEIVHLDKPEYWLSKVSGTFHGRDIFSPVAAHLAGGMRVEDLGAPLKDPVRIEFMQPQKAPGGWLAHITVVDIFGNLTTDLPAEAVKNPRDIEFRLHGNRIQGVLDSYGHAIAGTLVAVVDSEGFIELAEVNGNAAAHLNAKVGDCVEVIQPE